MRKTYIANNKASRVAFINRSKKMLVFSIYLGLVLFSLGWFQDIKTVPIFLFVFSLFNILSARWAKYQKTVDYEYYVLVLDASNLRIYSNCVSGKGNLRWSAHHEELIGITVIEKTSKNTFIRQLFGETKHLRIDRENDSKGFIGKYFTIDLEAFHFEGNQLQELLHDVQNVIAAHRNTPLHH